MGAPSRSVPLFNLGRQDLPWVVLLGVFSASVALILRSSQRLPSEARECFGALQSKCMFRSMFQFELEEIQTVA